MKIPGGATIWARKTHESEIFFYKPDKWFKMWFYIVNRVNHTDNKLFKRGEGLITYQNIMDETKASKSQVDKLIRFLKKERMATTRKTTRGMVITILNYEVYQDLGNYRDDKVDDLETKRRRFRDDTISNNVNNVKNKKNTSNGFDVFWKTYPKKVGKQAALRKWKQLKISQILLSKILSAIETQKKSDQWQKNNGQFIPHPTVWLNQGRWDDEPIDKLESSSFNEYIPPWEGEKPKMGLDE